MATAAPNQRMNTTIDDTYVPPPAYITFPMHARPIHGHDLNVTGVTKDDILYFWDVETRKKAVVGMYRGGGNGHIDIDVVSYHDHNEQGREYNPRLTGIEQIFLLDQKPMIRSLESDKLYVVQRVARVRDGEIVPHKPELVGAHHDG